MDITTLPTTCSNIIFQEAGYFENSTPTPHPGEDKPSIFQVATLSVTRRLLK
jgi:hypothetical protein